MYRIHIGEVMYRIIYVRFNPFTATGLFLHLLEASGNLSIPPENVRKPRFSDVFREYSKILCFQEV